MNPLNYCSLLFLSLTAGSCVLESSPGEVPAPLPSLTVGPGPLILTSFEVPAGETWQLVPAPGTDTGHLVFAGPEPAAIRGALRAAPGLRSLIVEAESGLILGPEGLLEVPELVVDAGGYDQGLEGGTLVVEGSILTESVSLRALRIEIGPEAVVAAGESLSWGDHELSLLETNPYKSGEEAWEVKGPLPLSVTLHPGARLTVAGNALKAEEVVALHLLVLGSGPLGLVSAHGGNLVPGIGLQAASGKSRDDQTLELAYELLDAGAGQGKGSPSLLATRIYRGVVDLNRDFGDPEAWSDDRAAPIHQEFFSLMEVLRSKVAQNNGGAGGLIVDVHGQGGPEVDLGFGLNQADLTAIRSGTEPLKKLGTSSLRALAEGLAPADVDGFLTGPSSLAARLAQSSLMDDLIVRPLGDRLDLEHAGKATINNALSRRSSEDDGLGISSLQLELSSELRQGDLAPVAAHLSQALLLWWDDVSK